MKSYVSAIDGLLPVGYSELDGLLTWLQFS